MKNNNGFTLVELVIVIALLGIMAIIGITRFAGLTEDARLQADITTAASIASVAQAWISQGDYSYNEGKIDIQSLKDANYLIEDIDYKTQTTDEDFEIIYNPGNSSIVVKAGDEQFYPVP